MEHFQQSEFPFMLALLPKEAEQKAYRSGLVEISDRKQLGSSWFFLGSERNGTHAIVEFAPDQVIKTVSDPSQIQAMWHNL